MSGAEQCRPPSDWTYAQDAAALDAAKDFELLAMVGKGFSGPVYKAAHLDTQ